MTSSSVPNLCAAFAVAVSTVAGLGAVSSPADAASCIVNTGPGSTGRRDRVNFDSRQHYAGEFTVTKSYVVTTVLGWFGISRDSSPRGQVRVSLHADGGDVPGATLFSKSFAPISTYIPFHDPVEPDPNPSWQGVSSVNWTIRPGTYWASFVPDENYQGTSPALGEGMPLDHYARGSSGAGWQSYDSGFPTFGVQVVGEPLHTQSVAAR